MKIKTYLALGDSYTIAEQVCLTESFPYQAVQLLRGKGMLLSAPEIIATTGFTTDELATAIAACNYLPAYDFVSILIGVNNQYRDRTVENFEIEFEKLLVQAIQFADGNSKKVFVLSIPDWGVTPFAAGRDIKQIALEIDAYNAVCQHISEKYNVHYIDITVAQRRDGHLLEFLASDQLHPSAKEYAKWAVLLADKMIASV